MIFDRDLVALTKHRNSSRIGTERVLKCKIEDPFNSSNGYSAYSGPRLSLKLGFENLSDSFRNKIRTLFYKAVLWLQSL